MHKDTAAARPVRRPPPEPGPPPPGGLLWDLTGDVRTVLTLPPAMALQVAHPAVGAGVDDHSVFRTDPWGRARRSLDSVLLWVYGGDRAQEEGRRLRTLHAGVRGTDAHGRSYRALDPATYAWVHATGFPVMRHARGYLGRPFTEEEERRLYAEWLQVGRVLGLRDRDMPQTLAAFWPYYRRMLDDEIESTPVLCELVSLTAAVPAPTGGPAVLRAALRVLWPLLRPPFLRLRAFVTVGLLPPEARQAAGLPWTPRQERRLRRFGWAVRVTAAVLPERLRYFPAARRARAQHRAGQYPG
ncbi:oxygenase MpaB family protein [Streptomyces sp. DSM 42041]|uniref:Oxygenase MpaB family protein n=1 Tax=Streptomyces hazeniae TaxID=3075538 RepID=A0ABU2NU36_9ACTN|nr:oxygenase MpaB family protein [Streptomyces sp. DSM 42041]MDT0380017.1 oxygenase MpaB family protein [Streptomyces sp. DSM 42041]